ncbi:MAG TPA: DUF1015 domain-containing protein [Syntrophorhabdaceae bacterium]|nr:DUF1015 domain-containing protein [Syntrophorhabdaceae bacterium]HQM81197.1 DUF1015 domain-containing protein [Syntrophorhabdaceae bacterium]
MPQSLTKPFKGILYNKEKIGDIALCVCPPYDVISNIRAYYEKDELNAIRLELPMATPSMDKYNNARETMEGWIARGILRQEDKETVYVYEQEFSIEDAVYTRRGFIATHKLSRDRILTHEETRKKAKADREQLISTLKTFTSLIFGLYEDREQEIENILISSKKEKIYDFVDEQSVRNRFYRMTDAEDMKQLTSMMDQKKIYIADGHHRLDVSYRLNIPYVPLYLTNMYSQGIVILPYHRIIQFAKKKNLRKILSSMEGFIEVTKHDYIDKDSLRAVFPMINESGRPSFLLYSHEDPSHIYQLTETAPIDTDKGVHEVLKKLKVNILHNGILKRLIGAEDEEISFTQDHYESVDLVQQGSLDLALFLPSTTVDEVKSIAENNLYMPPKSTFFYPKILTGLVFCKYA